MWQTVKCLILVYKRSDSRVWTTRVSQRGVWAKWLAKLGLECKMGCKRYGFIIMGGRGYNVTFLDIRCQMRHFGLLDFCKRVFGQSG